jgi:hypothetical protein
MLSALLWIIFPSSWFDMFFFCLVAWIIGPWAHPQLSVFLTPWGMDTETSLAAQQGFVLTFSLYQMKCEGAGLCGLRAEADLVLSLP